MALVKYQQKEIICVQAIQKSDEAHSGHRDQTVNALTDSLYREKAGRGYFYFDDFGVDKDISLLAGRSEVRDGIRLNSLQPE
jgi:hypothetical protein